MRKWIRIGFVLMSGILLGGCGRRELEDREFPTVLVADSADLSARRKALQERSSKYIDYGHVKAVILSEDEIYEPESLRKILDYLEGNPAFARNILMFAGDEEVLALAEKNEDDTGLYLEDLAKNRPGKEEEGLMLKDLLNYLHNSEASIEIPGLVVEGGALLPGESFVITRDAVTAGNIPVPKRVD